MAYGKDQNRLNDIATFRQSAHMHQAARPKAGGGGGGGAKPYFIDAFKPSTDEPDKVRLIKGRYEVDVGHSDGTLTKQTLFYFPFVEHFHGTFKKGFVCSAGPLGAFKGKGQPCMGHEIFFADKAAGKKNGPMSMRELYSFNVLHYAPYAHVEQLDRATGAIRTDSEGKPYMTWQRVFPHERAKFAGKEMVDARLLHWEMGYGHWATLLEYDKLIGRSCRSCCGRDTISMEAWTCRNCGEALIESNSTTLSPKEIEDITGDEVRCGSCGHIGLLAEVISCSNCDKAERADVFDVDLEVKRVTDPSGKSNQTTLAITSWSNPRPIDNRFIEIAKPMDLPKVFAPTPYEKQQAMLGGAGSSGRSPVTSGHARGYTTLGPGGKINPQY